MALFCVFTLSYWKRTFKRDSAPHKAKGRERNDEKNNYCPDHTPLRFDIKLMSDIENNVLSGRVIDLDSRWIGSRSLGGRPDDGEPPLVR